MVLGEIMNNIIDDSNEMVRLNKEKINNSLKAYFNSDHLPRKKKKMVKVQAKNDYNFWTSSLAYLEQNLFFGL